MVWCSRLADWLKKANGSRRYSTNPDHDSTIPYEANIQLSSLHEHLKKIVDFHIFISKKN